MIRYLILIFLVVLVIGLSIVRRNERIRRQKDVGIFHKRQIQGHPIFEHTIKRVKRQVEYTNSNLHKLTLFSFLFMIPGGVLGVMFKNMELGLLLSILFGVLPYIYMFILERRKQKLILVDMVPYLTSLDWVYESHSYSTSAALKHAEDSCPSVVRKFYAAMLQKIHVGVKPHLAMREFADLIRSNEFMILSGILIAQDQRNDPDSFRAAVRDLMRSVVKKNNRLSKVDSMLKKKQFFLIGLIATTTIIFWITFSMMNDAMGYFRSSEGAGKLVIGVIAMLIPAVIYLMSALRRRF